MIKTRRIDIVVGDKKVGTYQLTDVAVSGDRRIVDKEQEKIEKYQDLAKEIRKLSKVKTKVILIIIGALGIVANRLSGYLNDICINTNVHLLQKPVLLGSARIVRKVLES